MPNEAGLTTEGKASYDRMQTVRAHDDVKASCGRPLEGDIDAVIMVLQGGDRVTPEELDIIASGRQQDRGQFGARNLNL